MNEAGTRLKDPALAALRRQLRGATLVPADDVYGVRRRVWNAAIDRHPAGIVECADAEDVALALQIAAEFQLPVTIRGGGHDVAGRAVRDGALLLDLCRLRDIEINAAARVAIVQGGARWHDLDVAAARLGLATTGGLVSGMGVAGFTLGGGAGWLMRRWGLACDNLLAAAVLLADGRTVRASPTEHAELFWGLRGGGGGLGVLTALELALHPLQDVLAGTLVFDAHDAAVLLRRFRDFAAGAPDEFCGQAVILHCPALPFVDPEWHGRPVLMLVICWSGAEGGERIAADFARGTIPLGQQLATMPYVSWQHAQDVHWAPYRYHYWKTAGFQAVSDETLDQLAALAWELPTALTAIRVQHLGGGVTRAPAGESAFANRNTDFCVHIMGATAWSDEYPMLRERVNALHERIAGRAGSRLDDGKMQEQPGRALDERLQHLRQRYDPGELFRDGLPVRPAPSRSS